MDAYSEFRQLLEQHTGIDLGDGKDYLVNSRLGGVMREHNISSLAELVQQLRGGVAFKLQQQVIDAMTTNETQWFRDTQPFQLLSSVILPELSGARTGSLRIWSTACSSGQEPYSIAMQVDEYRRGRLGSLRSVVEILGTDISRKVLTQAQNGFYDRYSIERGLSAQRRSRYFLDRNDGWQVQDTLKREVRFRELNLLRSFATLGRFQVIFCRNVLIYFSQERRRDIVQRMVDILQPAGYLLLGASETPPPGVEGLEMQRVPEGIVYRRRA